MFSGLRPGEKLYEELLIDVQDKKTTEHPKIFHGYEKTPDWGWVLSTIEELHRAMQYCWPHGAPENCNCEELRNILKRRLEGYQPQCGIVDVIWEKSGQTDFQDLSLETFREN